MFSVNKILRKFSFVLMSLCVGFYSFSTQSFGQNLDSINAVSPETIFGELRARNSTALSSELPARIEKLTFREGFRFNKGDALIKLDCALIRAQYEKTKAQSVAAKRKYDVEKRLFQLNSTGELDVLNAEAEMLKVDADIKAGRVRLSKCVIKAPFSGRIVKRKMGEHQFAQVGKEVLEIIDDQNLEIAFLVPSKWIMWLKTGYKFMFRVNETGKEYAARVIQRGAKVDAVSRSIVMIGETIKRHPELVPGMSGFVRIEPPNSK